MAEYIAVGITELAGADFTLADGASVTINLKPATNALVALPADVVADVQVRTSDAGYVNAARLTAITPPFNVQGPGTFRVIRRASAGICGVDKT
jgi:hypothetical protein